MKNRTLGALLALTIAAVAAQAGEPQSRPVGYLDLNLDTRQDNEVLYARISAAARNVCGVTKVYRDVAIRRRHERCVQMSIDDAVKRVDNPLLTSVAGANARSALHVASR